MTRLAKAATAIPREEEETWERGGKSLRLRTILNVGRRENIQRNLGKVYARKRSRFRLKKKKGMPI